MGKYIHFSLLNLFVIAIYGVLMRYKIGFEFPFLDQKYLQHAHSHFAFSGWISHTLMLLMIKVLNGIAKNVSISKYKFILTANLICSYGMLVSFTFMGYETVSITFSTLSLVVSFLFAYNFLKDSQIPAHQFRGKKWFTAAIVFNLLSAAGTLVLGYMMATKSINQNLYLASVYYYLHFQYNGWFFFACMGLFMDKLNQILPEYHENKKIFNLFVLSCVPAYFLSTLWMKLPIWLYGLVVLAALAQVTGWLLFLKSMKRNFNKILQTASKLTKYLVLFVMVAVTIKLLLQLFSTIPSISELAFGFRTIVIAYLHLVLLAIISTFLLSYLYFTGLISENKSVKWALFIFTSGILFNELVLLIQGIASFSYTLIPYANEALFGISLILLFGSLLLFVGNICKKETKI